MAGAASARKRCLENEFEENDSLQYAAIRNILLRKGKSIEITCSYEPSLLYIGEWWKQLYGESEGKDQRGIFPASVTLTADLHSMGQFIQDGARTVSYTHLFLETGGVRSVSEYDFSDSRILEGDEWLEFHVKYRVEILEGLIPIPGLSLIHISCMALDSGRYFIDIYLRQREKGDRLR